MQDITDVTVPYKFYLVATNFNGQSLNSDVVQFNAGTVPG